MLDAWSRLGMLWRLTSELFDVDGDGLVRSDG